MGTQTRISSAAPAATTDPAVSAWTRADAPSTPAERPGCTAASSAAAWSVHRTLPAHSSPNRTIGISVVVTRELLSSDEARTVVRADLQMTFSHNSIDELSDVAKTATC